MTQIQQDLQQLGTDARAEFGDDASKVETAATSLQSSVAAAKPDPSASTLSAVGTEIQAVEQQSVSAAGRGLRHLLSGTSTARSPPVLYAMAPSRAQGGRATCHRPSCSDVRDVILAG